MADISTITASNGTTYNIKDASIAKMWTSTNNTLENKDVIKQYISSRGENLVTNGTALLGNNYNFSSFTFDGSDSYYAGGCFSKTNSTGQVLPFDEYIPVDVGKTYEYSYYIKTNNTSAKYYDTISSYDIDKNIINPYHVLFYANTTTTLARDLNDGDTKVYLSGNLSNFFVGTADANGGGLIFWNYTNSKGYTYPAETYSRNVYTGLYAKDGSGFDTTNNIITLSSAWNKGPISAGTAVSQEKSGGTYIYLNSNYSLPNTEWNYKTGKIGGGTASNNNNDKVRNGVLLFKEGTAFLKLGIYLNSSPSISNVTSKISTISFGISIPDVNAPLKVYTSVTGTAAVTSSPYYCARYDVTDPSITKYTNGMMVSIRVPVAGNGSYGTALQINSLGYKPIVYNVNTMISTRYGVGSQITAVYNSTQTGSLYLNSSSATTVTGCWQVNDYDSNDVNYQSRVYYGTPKVNSATPFSVYMYMILLPMMDGTVVPISNGNDQRTTYTKTINTTNAFNPFGRFYYNYSTNTYAAGAAIGTGVLYDMAAGTTDIRYSLNINASGTAGTTSLTANQPIYLKAKYNYNLRTAVLVPNSASSNYLERSSIVQTLPSTNPDTALTADETYIYIFLGYAYDKYRYGFQIEHPVYNWDAVNNCIQVFDGNRPEAVVFVSQSSTFSEIYNIKQKGKIPIYKDADGFAFPEQVEDSSPSAFTFTKATDAGVIKWYKVDTADAWTSGTKDTKELFECTYGTTTYAEITQALTNGKMPVVKNPNTDALAWYSGIASSRHVFRTFSDNYQGVIYRVDTSNVWSAPTYNFEATGNKVTSLSSSSTDTQYPSAKCVYDAIQSAGGHSTTYYAQNQSVSTGNNVTVTAPNYYAYGQYFVDITGYIYSTSRTTRVYLKPTNSSMDIFYGEIVDCDLDGGLYDQFFVILEKVSSTSYTYRCVESGQEYSFLDLMKKATTYRSNSGHTLTNFGVIL